MRQQLHRRVSRLLLLVMILGWVATGPIGAVTSRITRQSSGSTLLKGQTDTVVISSRGTIQLAKAAELLIDDFEDVWSVNCIVAGGSTLYIGTSPNGSVFSYERGKLEKIYPAESNEPADENGADETNADDEAQDLDEPDDEPFAKELLSNEHIFAMTTDIVGRLLVGISGDDCRLCRFENDRMHTLFKPENALYIFAIVLDKGGNIYMGTGPDGRIYKLDPAGKTSQLAYDSPDKNILSLAVGPDGFIYAGSDTRGLVYKVNPRNRAATVLYDADQPEVTALLFGPMQTPEAGNLYAAATMASVVSTEAKFAAQPPAAGRPEAPEEEETEPTGQGGRRLQIANTQKAPAAKSPSSARPPTTMPKPTEASYIYRVDTDGYVTRVFGEAAVFFCLAQQDDRILVGTGNDAQLYAVDPASEQESIIYEDEQASQITSMAVVEDDVFIGTSNPAKLIRLSSVFAGEGTYTSDLIDAGQPAKWGKLQIDADIPRGSKVLVASRSGNVKDVNDPTFSDWTELVEITEPIQLRCPLGRYCQYKLVLMSKDGKRSPLIREIAVASTVPNLAPKVLSVSAARVQGAGKEGLFKISFKAQDTNADKLIYAVHFRKIGRSGWIELEDELEAESLDWNSNTVEDGRYEIRVVADDVRGNTVTSKLTGSRISDPIVVDNTGPAIRKHSISKNGKTATLKLQVVDELSAIDELSYTIDSNAQWRAALPDDLVYDTTEESFTITTQDLKPGEHIIALRIRDSVGNATYKSFEVSLLAE